MKSYSLGMKKVLVVVFALISAFVAHDRAPLIFGPATASNAELAQAIDDRRSGVQVTASGTVVRVLPDDNDGSRHQRFIVALESGETLLVAHNIDLAPRVRGLKNGDEVSVFGEYEWNEKGGVIHWTHHDPQGWHVGGWVELRGVRYE